MIYNKVGMLRLRGILAIAFCVLTFVSEETQASQPTISTNFSYIVRHVDPETMRNSLGTIGAEFEKQGFVAFDATLNGNLPSFGVDQVFSDFTRKQAVFLKLGLEPEDPFFRDQLLEIPAGPLVFHARTTSGTPFALVFHNMPAGEARRFALNMTKLSYHAKRWPALFNEAHADSGPPGVGCRIFEAPSFQGQLEGINPIASRLDSSQIADQWFSCLGSALHGAWASTGGAAIATAGAAIDFAKHPIESLRALGKKMDQLWQFLGRIGPELSKSYRHFADLDAETKTVIGCEFLGGVGTDVALGILTGGLASAKWPVLAAKMAAFGQELSRVSKVLQYASKLGDRGSAALKRKFLRGLMSGTEEAHIGAIQKISDAGFDDLAWGATTCGI